MAATRKRSRRDVLGEVFTWLSGGALALNLLMILGLLALLAWMGMGYFWPKYLHEVTLQGGTKLWGELHDREKISAINLSEEERKKGPYYRINLKVGNRKYYKEVHNELDFRWVDEARIESVTTPPDLVQLERLEWGNFHGRLLALRTSEGELDLPPEKRWSKLQELIRQKAAEREAIRAIEKGELGDLSHRLAKLRLERRRVELASLTPQETERRLADIVAREKPLREKSLEIEERLIARRDQLHDTVASLETAEGDKREVAVGDIVRATRPNAMSTIERIGLYLTRIWEFLVDEPRESNTEGGIFPAIFGTVLMVFIMTFAVTPFGVLAALYLREYAREGPLIRLVRIAVNNLAGVPSIVFGVFGLGFFVYLIGGTIDDLFYPEAQPAPTFGTGGILWASLTLALLTVPVVIVATEEGLAAVPTIVRQGSLALGATKFETIRRVVLPAAGPGILTGIILAIARAAGEVAPLMIVGMVKLAPALPVDQHFPFLHLERKFMHLGFHIYDVGFQSPNVEATKPLVYATALLLVLLVTVMNLTAIGIRNHLRSKHATSAV